MHKALRPLGFSALNAPVPKSLCSNYYVDQKVIIRFNHTGTEFKVHQLRATSLSTRNPYNVSNLAMLRECVGEERVSVMLVSAAVPSRDDLWVVIH